MKKERGVKIKRNVPNQASSNVKYSHGFRMEKEKNRISGGLGLSPYVPLVFCVHFPLHIVLCALTVIVCVHLPLLFCVYLPLRIILCALTVIVCVQLPLRIVLCALRVAVCTAERSGGLRRLFSTFV